MEYCLGSASDLLEGELKTFELIIAEWTPARLQVVYSQ